MELIRKYFPGLTTVQNQQMEMLAPLYAEWNEKVNTISRKDIENLYERHVLSSMGIAKVISFKPGTSILDAGTGGGFPGIPLAILFPEVQFRLIDSIGKKTRVADSVALSLGLKNVETAQQRLEKEKGKYDFVVSRAVTRIPKFVTWCRGKFRKDNFNDLPNGILYLKGGDFNDELAEIRMHSKLYDMNCYFEEDFFETKKLVHIWEPKK